MGEEESKNTEGCIDKDCLHQDESRIEGALLERKKVPKLQVLLAGIVGFIVGAAVMFLPNSIMFHSQLFCLHTWKPATCESPQYCTKCDKFVGERDPEGHLWNEANCSQPRTCAYCGITDGDISPNNHSWSDAFDKGYAICERCGKVTGEIPD